MQAQENFDETGFQRVVRRVECIEDALNSSEKQEIIQNFGKNLDKFVKQNSRLLKITWKDLPFNNKISIGDITFHDHNKEHHNYLYDKEIHEKVRIGLSILKVHDENFKIIDIKIARRGLKKFFELKESHVLYLEGEIFGKKAF